eukprot:5025046-Pleurochrysis_carterae.AAC.1
MQPLAMLLVAARRRRRSRMVRWWARTRAPTSRRSARVARERQRTSARARTSEGVSVSVSEGVSVSVSVSVIAREIGRRTASVVGMALTGNAAEMIGEVEIGAGSAASVNGDRGEGGGIDHGRREIDLLCARGGFGAMAAGSAPSRRRGAAETGTGAGAVVSGASTAAKTQ